MKLRPAFLLLLLMPFYSWSQASPGITGSWKETTRAPSGKPQPFTDTARIDFLTGNEYLWSQPGRFSYRGTYTLSKGTLDLGSRTFTAKLAGQDALQLVDESGVQYVFTRYTREPERTDDRAATSGSRGSNGIQGGPPAEFSTLLGRWEVYKRTTATPAAERTAPDLDRLLRVIDVKENSSGLQGLVYAANDGEGTASWYVDRYRDGTLYCKGKEDRVLQVIGGGSTELVLSEGAITYFFRKTP